MSTQSFSQLVALPDPLLLIIYAFLDNPFHKTAFRLSCTRLWKAVSNGKRTVIHLKDFEESLFTGASVTFFKWARTLKFRFHLHHLTPSNNLELIQYCVGTRFYSCKSDKVYKTSSLPCLQYLASLPSFKWEQKYVLYAAEKGSLECVQYALQNGCSLDEEVFHAAILGGNMEVIQYLHQNGCPWTQRTTSVAARGGHLEVLKYLHRNGYPWNKWICKSAVKGNHLKVLKYAYENGCPLTEETFSIACMRGYLEIVQYLYEKNCHLSTNVLSVAASHGQIKVIEYLHKNSCLRSASALNAAVCQGHLEVVDFLHKSGYTLNNGDCEKAAKHGHLKILQYLVQHGCPWDIQECLEWAICRNYKEMEKWIHQIILKKRKHDEINC